MTQEITSLVQRQREFFAAGKTKPIQFRLATLDALATAIRRREGEILGALAADMKKPPFEAYASEVGGVLDSITLFRSNLSDWATPRPVPTPLHSFPATSSVHPLPRGVALIIGPWNYPFLLMLDPLVAAIGAGNCAVLKPSEFAPRTSAVIAALVRDTFDSGFITVVEGDAHMAQALLAERFDHIFFTGGNSVARLVMQAAAKHLTPVTLELGGKSPCIVEPDTDLPLAARRIAWGKFFNAGQTCVAPDYLLAHRSIAKELLTNLADAVKMFYGDDPRKSPDFARIVNRRHFDRVRALLGSGTPFIGGGTDEADLYSAPTILTGVTPDSPVMQEEIMGPVLPVLEYVEMDEALTFVNRREKPLALYLFSSSPKTIERVRNETASGGLCINDTLVQIANSHMPFGGMGESGIGAYRGKTGFDTFSHHRAEMQRGTWLDVPLRYPPFKGGLRFLRWFIGR